MRVLFVGEGPHDIGRHDHFAPEETAAQGVVQVLSRKVCPHIAEDSPSLRWAEIARFNPAAKKKGFEAKVPAARLLAERKYDCTAVVLVTDRDGDRARQEALRSAAEPHDNTVAGIAVESIEAWTLGALEAIAAELDLDVNRVRAEYPSTHVESLYEQSGKPELRSKGLLQRIAELARTSDGAELRRRIAERTDVDALARRCPNGFGLFAEALRRKLRAS